MARAPTGAKAAAPAVTTGPLPPVPSVGTAVVWAAVLLAAWEMVETVEAAAEEPEPALAAAQSFWAAGRTLPTTNVLVSFASSTAGCLDGCDYTSGISSAAGGDDAIQGITLDLAEVVRGADALEVIVGARGGFLNGVSQTRLSANGDVVDALGADQGGHGDNGSSCELHFDGIKGSL